MRGLQNDVYCQIGLVMLIGLASKNAILIVEFAEQLQHRGLSLVDSAIEAARLRLRPILMTSIAFILGVLPSGLCQRRRRGRPALRRDYGIWRNDYLHVLESVYYPGALYPGARIASHEAQT